MATLLGYTPEDLMGTKEWEDLSPDDRSYVVDNWAAEYKEASPEASPDEMREFNRVIDEFRAAAAPSFMEKSGKFLGGVAESIPRSLAAAAQTMPAYAGEAGRSIGNELVGASGGEFLRSAPLTTRTGLAVPGTVQNLGNWSRRQMGGQKAREFQRMQGKLAELQSTLLDGDDDPKALKSLATQVAVAAAGYHGDDPTGYLYAGAPDGLADPNSFADLVKAERQPKVINSQGTQDADLRGMRTIHADPENLALAAAFRQTRNPAYFEQLANRLTLSDANLRKESLTYANALPDQAEYEKGWGDLSVLKYMRGAVYGQAESPIDTALSLSGVGGLFRGAKAAAAGGLTLGQLGRGALKSTAVEGTSGAASAIGADARVTGGEVLEQAAAEVLGEAGGAAGAYAVGRGVRAVVGSGGGAAGSGTTVPSTNAAPEAPAPDPGTAAAGLDLPTGPGEVDPSLLPDLTDQSPPESIPFVEPPPADGTPELTPSTSQDPAGTVPERPEALAEQKRRVARGNQAGMIVPGTRADSLPLELQPDENDSLVVTDTPDGAVIHALDISREEVLAAQANGTLMETLGYATSQKPTTPDAVAVTVRTEDGTEVSAELAAPEDIPAAIDAAAAKADPTDTVALEEPAAVVADRIEPAPDGLVPEAPSLEEAMATAPRQPLSEGQRPAQTRSSPAEAVPPHTSETLPSETAVSPANTSAGASVQIEANTPAAIEAWADRTIAEGRKRLNTGLDPELAAAYAVKGVAIIARGVRDFAAWSAEMIQEFGEVIRPHLQRIFDQSTGNTESDLASVAAGGQTVQSLPPGYDINRFGIRLQADERLRASWRERFTPALYKTFTEEGLARDVRQWIADNGGLAGASSLFLDDSSGLKDFERNALGQQLAIALDLRAVRMERQGNTDGVHEAEAALESVTAKLETLATQAGQALRAFGLWSKLTPRGLVRATQRKVEETRETHVNETLGITPDKAVQVIEQAAAPQPQDNEILRLWNMMQEAGPTALGRSIAATLRAIMPQARDWRRRIDSQFVLANLRESMTDSGGERLVRNFFQLLAPSRDRPGPLASFDRATQELLSQTLREAATRAGIVSQQASQQPDAIDRIVLALSNDPLRMDKLQAADALMQEQLAERPELRAAWEEATAAMATQIAGPGLLRRTLRQALQQSRPAWAEAFRTGQPLTQAVAGIRQATVDAVMAQVRQRVSSHLDPNAAVMLPALQAELTAAFDTIAAERYAQWQGQQEQAAARARVTEARRRFLAALRPGNMTQARIDRLDAILQADALGAPETQTAANPLTELLGKHLRKPVPDFVAQAQALGVPPEVAADFDQAVGYHRDKAERAARERAIESLIKALGPRTPRAVTAKVPRLVSSLMKAAEIGALTRSAFLDAYATAFDLPRLTPALAAEIRARVAAVDAAPKGSWLRQRAMADLMATLALHEGVKSSDVLTAYWYANILSGIGTQLVNISGNASHLLLKSVQQILTHHPREIAPYIRGMLDGAIQGASQGWMAFKDGEPVLRTEEKWERTDVLQMLWDDNPKTLGRLIAKYGAASWGRYVFRGLTAMDAMFYTTAKEGRAWVDVSRSLAKGQSLEKALGYDVASWTAAQQQAAQDLAAAGRATPSTREVDRRAHEILEARRGADVLASSRRFGAETTFNYEPEGTLGALAMLISRFIAVAPPFRLVVPFTRIVANLTDKALDWTPYGLVRAGLGRHMFNNKDRRFTNQERQERIVSGALSLVGGAALYAAAKANEDQDDESVQFMIYGLGPATKAKRDQMPAGWRPMTIKIGNKYISYSETPLNLLLGAIGGAMDLRRYGSRKDSDEPMARAQALLGGMGNGIMRSGMLSGMAQIYDAATGRGKPASFVFRSVSGLIPAQGFMRNLAEVIDPVKLDTATFSGAMLQNLPILRGEGQPLLNAFGEPVSMPGPWLVSRLVTSNSKPDPDAVWLGQNKLSLPGYDNDIVVGTYLTKDDKARLRAAGGNLEADRRRRAENMARLENGYLTTEERTAFIRRAGALQRDAVRQLRTQTAGRPIDPKILKRQLEAKVTAARRIAMRQQMGLAPK